MLLANFLKWWYGSGFKNRCSRLGGDLLRTVDFFSIDLLANSLFQPFRMIDAQKIDKGALEERLSSFLDRLISRLVGASLRSLMLIVGSLVLILHLSWAILALLFWLSVPLLPVVSLILFTLRVVPPWLN